ncbi:MAG: DUF4259 domain-containing protein [Pseudanabaenaceae cyanobacterium bins.68]|nr:DUF4259 domain-containing protein [Pseudanabaenaceae cyanobacterium bins.68]
MGAWGIGSFENDDSADWIDDFSEDPSMEFVLDALSTVVEKDDTLETEEAAVAIAAAEIVAALKQQPHPQLPASIQAWLKKQPPADEPLTALALRAIDLVKTNSELQVLWEETPDSEAWQLELDQIADRLTR